MRCAQGSPLEGGASQTSEKWGGKTFVNEYVLGSAPAGVPTWTRKSGKRSLRRVVAGFAGFFECKGGSSKGEGSKGNWGEARRHERSVWNDRKNVMSGPEQGKKTTKALWCRQRWNHGEGTRYGIGI